MSREKCITVTSPNVLLVEGADDRRFFQAFLRELGLSAQVQEMLHGVQSLKDSVGAVVGAPGFEEKATALGVVRDANSDPAAAFQSMCDALVAAGLDAPTRCCEITDGTPRVAVMVVPSESTTGSLENLLIGSVQDDPATPCMDGYFECLSQSGLPGPRSRSKAQVHAFLASREKPGLRIGEAADAGYWPWTSSAFDPVKRFLADLFA